MASDLHARLLAEIERREDLHRMAMMPPRITRPIERRDVTAEMQAMARGDEALAYLGALRKVVGLHTGPHQCHDLEGTVTIVRDECATLLAVAEGLGVGG